MSSICMAITSGGRNPSRANSSNIRFDWLHKATKEIAKH
jgi:hypothetical protein